MTKTSSNLMTKEEIIAYVSKEIKYFETQARLKCKEIGDGNINYVFKVYDQETGKSLVVKQADSLLRSSGRPLDIYRSKIEAEILKIQDRLLPGSVPKVYHYDEDKALLVMEDISSYHNLRKELLAGRLYPNLPDEISDFLSMTLLPTTDLVLDRQAKKDLVKKFTNPELCDITEDLVLTEPYYNYKDRNIISPGLEDFVQENLYENYSLQCQVLKLKDRFQSYSQALIHGDLHSGSIFVNESGIKVIDPEFAFYGPIAYDIGNVWGNLIFPLVHHIIMDSDIQLVQGLKKILEATIDKTIKKLDEKYDRFVEFPYFKNEAFKTFYLGQIITDSFGYAGTEIIRRTVGDSKVLEVTSVTDSDKRLVLDRSLVKIGMGLIQNMDELKNGSQVLAIIEKEVEIND